jgi:hypothetical protein
MSPISRSSKYEWCCFYNCHLIAVIAGTELLLLLMLLLLMLLLL